MRLIKLVGLPVPAPNKVGCCLKELSCADWPTSCSFSSFNSCLKSSGLDVSTKLSCIKCLFVYSTSRYTVPHSPQTTLDSSMADIVSTVSKSFNIIGNSWQIKWGVVPEHATVSLK